MSKRKDMTTLTIAGNNLTPNDCLKNDRIYLRIKKIKGTR